MSFAVDVNLLLYASARRSPHHDRALSFLRRCHTERSLWCIPWITVMSYLRMSTHPAIVSPPLDPQQAMRNVEALIELPHVRVLSEQDGFWGIYRQVAEGLAVRSKLVPDVHLAALLRQHGVDTICTNDRDFLKFPFLRVVNPLARD